MPDQSDNNTPAATAKPDHATVMVGDGVIFEAQPKPPRIKQLDPETFATDGPDGRMTAPSAQFHKFIRICLQEIAGITVGRYWLRDQQRKARGK